MMNSITFCRKAQFRTSSMVFDILICSSFQIVYKKREGSQLWGNKRHLSMSKVQGELDGRVNSPLSQCRARPTILCQQNSIQEPWVAVIIQTAIPYYKLPLCCFSYCYAIWKDRAMLAKFSKKYWVADASEKHQNSEDTFK